MSLTPILIALVVALGTLYWKGWLHVPSSLAAAFTKARGYGVVLVVFASAFLMTRNLGLATIAAVLVYSAFSRNMFLNQGATNAGAKPAPAPYALHDAYAMLGLPLTANEDEVMAAYRTLIMRNHPDQGGSTDIAAKLNQAKTLILKHLRAKH